MRERREMWGELKKEGWKKQKSGHFAERECFTAALGLQNQVTSPDPLSQR